MINIKIGHCCIYRSAVNKTINSHNILLKTYPFFILRNIRCLEIDKQRNSQKNVKEVLFVCFFLLGNSPASEFRRRGITQKKKTYNIHNTAKI
jgi:hypothetical protein